MKTALVKKFSFLALMTAILALFAAAVHADITVSSEAELAALGGTAVSQNVNIVGKTYDMSSYTWTPIKSLASGCVINGNGAVIDGIDLATVVANKWSGFLGQNNGTIQNLSVRSSSNVSVRKVMGGIAAENKGTINNCVVYADTEGSVAIDTAGNIRAGGVAGDNTGSITNCMVKNLSFTSDGADYVGGIAGNNQGTISTCYVYNTYITNVNGSASGAYGLIAGYNNAGGISVCSAEYSSVETDASYAGCIAGYVSAGSSIANTRIKSCDVLLNGAGSIGGLCGYVYNENDTRTTVASCYFGGARLHGIQKSGSGNAGGVVGILSSDNSSNQIFYKCWFSTDTSNVSDLWGDFIPNAAASNLQSCGGATLGQMRGLGWAASNLGSGWQNDRDLYPVYADANVRLVAISRPVKNGVALSRNIFRVKVGDLNDISFVRANATIARSSIQLVDMIGDGTNITADAFTLNGADITGDILVSGYETLDFSARVTNHTAAALQATVADYQALYNSGLRMYTPASLATLKTAIDNANDALSDHYVNITKTEADALTGAMHSASLDALVCVITFDAQNGSVQYGGSAVASVEKEKNATIQLTAVPDSGYEFVYWKDSAGNIIGSETSLSYMVTRTTTVTAEFRSSSSYIFTYKDNYGKTYKIQPVSDYSEVAYPAEVGQGGMKTGFVVESWSNDYEGDLPASGEVTGDVTFTAKLVRNDSETFTVKYKTNQGDTEWIEETGIKTGYVFSTTAADSYGGSDFSYWMDGDGNIVTYDKTVSVSVYSDMELTPYFLGAESSVTVASLQAPVVYAGAGKISFTGQVVFGDDFSSEAYHGVLLCQSNTALADLDFNTPGVIVGKSSGYSALTHTFIINKKNVAAGDTWYGRAFIVYYDTNNEMQIAFSDIKSATLN
ncbi:MAG: hypothetical protein J5758_03430 [Abditibacteriota bacterium]|nr:hypothetical protein [Abditibacteriota bacterium]